MLYQVTFPMGLRAAPNLDAERLGTVDFSTPVEIVEKSTDGTWVSVKVRIDQADRVGFLLAEYLREAPKNNVEEQIDIERFLDQLIYASRMYEVNHYYLGAVAWVESRIRNVINEKTGAAGPFQFLSSTWDNLVKKYGADLKATSADRKDVTMQAFFAALYTRESTTLLRDSLDRLPDGAELYLAHLLGAPAAAAVLAGGRASPIDVPLREFYSNRSDPAEFVKRIVNGNAGLLSSGDEAHTVETVLRLIRLKLDEGLQAISAPLAKLKNKAFGNLSGSIEPPWLTAARAQVGIEEFEGKDKSNPEVEKYHASTTFGKPHPDDVAWCASFVSWCMAQSNDSAVAGASIKSPRAADWLKWGLSVATPPLGAIAVLKPLVDGSSGHVGFVTDVSETKVRLLGGNQGNPDQVCELDFPLQDVVDFRWLIYQ